MAARTYSKATLELAMHGVNQQQVADLLNVDRSYVSHMLSGRIRSKPGLDVALRSLIGTDGANKVLAAITEKAS